MNMAFTRHSGKLLFKLLAGIALTACAAAPGSNTTAFQAGEIRRAFSPTWGPDGQRIAFLYKSRAAGSADVHQYIYSTLLDGTDVVKISELSPPRFKSLNWSPTGERFALTTDDTQEVYTVERNGQNLTKIGDGDQPSWEPTGTKLVFVNDNLCDAADRVGGRQCQRQVRLFDTASKVTIGIPIKLAREITAPAWTPDGLKVQWLTTETPVTKELNTRDMVFQSYNIGTQTSESAQVGPITITLGEGSWSNDRTTLVFQYLSQLQLFSLADKKITALVDGLQPQMSIDSNRILYTRSLGLNQSDIALFDRRGNREQVIISHSTLPLN